MTRFGFILQTELPARVEEILAENNPIRWRYEGFHGTLGICGQRAFDENLAAMLARKRCEPEEIASAIFQRPRHQAVGLQYAMQIAEEAFVRETNSRDVRAEWNGERS